MITYNDYYVQEEREKMEAASTESVKPRHDAPHGMEPYDLGSANDLGALSDEQQKKLNDFKIKTRLENEVYLWQHPEIDCMIQGFVSEVLRNRPEELKQYAANYFTDPELAQKIEKQMSERQQHGRMNDMLKQL